MGWFPAIRQCLFAVALALPFTSVLANDPLAAYFEQLRTLRADFVQTVEDGGSRMPQRSTGRVLLERPGRFRWDYQTPYEQVIVSDGERIWHYDADLEQVTVQRLDESMDSTPLALLMGQTPLESSFKVEALGETYGEDWFELIPLGPESQFNRIRLALSGGELSALELEDALGSLTRLRFEAMERNGAIDPAELEFVPPAGADVVGDG
jgi:chaperone LolA